MRVGFLHECIYHLPLAFPLVGEDLVGLLRLAEDDECGRG